MVLANGFRQFGQSGFYGEMVEAVTRMPSWQEVLAISCDEKPGGRRIGLLSVISMQRCSW
jgi:hypothetical protein